MDRIILLSHKSHSTISMAHFICDNKNIPLTEMNWIFMVMSWQGNTLLALCEGNPPVIADLRPPPLPHTTPQPQTHTGTVLLSGFQSSPATLDSHENNNWEIKRMDNAISFDIIFSVNLTKLLNKEWSFWYLSILEVYKWISNFIPHFIMDVITFPYWDWNQTMLVKGAPVSRYHLYCQFLDMIFTTLW